MRGTVKFFNVERGFGFVKADDGSEYFVSNIISESRNGWKTLQDGERIEFETIMDVRGLRAVNVVRLGPSPWEVSA